MGGKGLKDGMKEEIMLINNGVEKKGGVLGLTSEQQRIVDSSFRDGSSPGGNLLSELLSQTISSPTTPRQRLLIQRALSGGIIAGAGEDDEDGGGGINDFLRDVQERVRVKRGQRTVAASAAGAKKELVKGAGNFLASSDAGDALDSFGATLAKRNALRRKKQELQSEISRLEKRCEGARSEAASDGWSTATAGAKRQQKHNTAFIHN